MNSGSSSNEIEHVLRLLGREIAAERVRRGWTQAELAAAASDDDVSVSRKQVGKIERGERGQLHEVWRLAMTLGMQFSRMVADAEDEARNAS